MPRHITSDESQALPGPTGLGLELRWLPGLVGPRRGDDALQSALRALRQPFFVVDDGGQPAVAFDGLLATRSSPGDAGRRLLAWVPACPVEALGDASFKADHGLRYAYVTGAMANGIASAEIVEQMAGAGMLGFFGAAGLALEEVEGALVRLQSNLSGRPFGSNFIHSPHEPALEAALADLYTRRGLGLVEASAFLELTLPIVRYRTAGIARDRDGRIVTPHRVVAKVSRIEVAEKFLSPPPATLLRALVAEGALSPEQAELAAHVPMAQDVTAEADSGGHTDNRPLVTLLPVLIELRDRLARRFDYGLPLRIGAAGGIATPAAAAGAFAMGAAYVVTGSVNQACLESRSSDAVRAMLAQAEQADSAMAPAADMFEMGIKVQVLKRNTRFAMRAQRLYDLYRSSASLEALTGDTRAALERDIFRAPLEEIWSQTRAFFLARDPAQVERAEADPKHRLALVFRWYLGLSSLWANTGEPTRRLDYQIWCGPAMGAFNEWARGSLLESWRERRVALVARNILAGAAVLTRAHMLRAQHAMLGRDVAFGPLSDRDVQVLMA